MIEEKEESGRIFEMSSPDAIKYRVESICVQPQSGTALTVAAILSSQLFLSSLLDSRIGKFSSTLCGINWSPIQIQKLVMQKGQFN